MKFIKRIRFKHYLARNIAACEIASLLFYKLPALPGKTKEQMAFNYIGWLHDIDIYIVWDNDIDGFAVDPKWMDYF